ncbi:MAG: hypothetical protein IKV16_06145 [Clostridia bacterium]|nr:hypothetical protein [Clostridia bacterium]
MTGDNFNRARISVLGESFSTEGVGGLNERSLHKILKLALEPRAEYHEVRYLGSIADIKNEEGIFEIQTKIAYKLLPKLQRFLLHERVTLVIPIIEEKYVTYLEESGMSKPRKSPKAENVYTALSSVAFASTLLRNDKFSIMLVYLCADEYKYRVKKRGQRKIDVIPSRLLRTELISSPCDVIKYFPAGLSEEFVATEFSRAIKKPSRFTYFVIKFFESLGFIEEIGMRGRAKLYKIKDK